MSTALKQRGVLVSPGGVRSLGLRHPLETFRQRLSGREKKGTADHLLGTEAQGAALESSKQEQEAQGESETEHPGY